MKGNAKVLHHLNETLKAELTAINQYFLHASMCKNWGYERMAKKQREEAVEEMKHAEILMDRILFLEGAPDMTDMFPIKIGQNIKQQLQNDLALELDAIPRLNAAIKTAVEVGDNASRELFQKILVDEEEHVDYLEAQLGMIKEVGLELYLSQQMHE
ncbi:MAG: bacterioferritin [Acidobacteria bacterium]|nr:bacterioferritin [Acidobacteriota bacterium]